MQLNGSQIFVEVLCEQGVDTLFGYPGGAVLNLYDELYRNTDRIKYHAGDEAVREAGATRIVPYRESVSVIRDEHVPVLWPVFVPGDT